MFMRAVHPGEVLKGELEELGDHPDGVRAADRRAPQPG